MNSVWNFETRTSYRPYFSLVLVQALFWPRTAYLYLILSRTWEICKKFQHFGRSRSQISSILSTTGKNFENFGRKLITARHFSESYGLRVLGCTLIFCSYSYFVHSYEYVFWYEVPNRVIPNTGDTYLYYLKILISNVLFLYAIYAMSYMLEAVTNFVCLIFERFHNN